MKQILKITGLFCLFSFLLVLIPQHESDARWVDMGAGHGFYAEQLLTATDLVDTKQLSRFIYSRGASAIKCEMDVTAISGASATVYLQIQACDPLEIAADGCTDFTDTTNWVQGAGVTTVTEDAVLLTAVPISGIAGSAAEKQAYGPIPPIWAVYVNETGTTTVSYTVDCVWW